MRTVKTYHVKDIWQQYVLQLLAANPDWTTRCNSKGSPGTRANYYVLRPYDKFDTKLKNKKVEVINYKIFLSIITDYFERAKEAVVQGELLNLRARLGKICMSRIQRDFRKKTVNFGKTNKYPKVLDPVTGLMKREKIIYLVDEEWFQVTWLKQRAITNEVFYEFCPANAKSSLAKTADTSFATLRSKALEADPKLKFKYVYKPLTKPTSYAV